MSLLPLASTFLLLALAGTAQIPAPSFPSDLSEALVHFEKGRVFQGAKAIYRAIEEHTEAIRLQPRWSDAYLNRSAMRLVAGDLEGSLRDVEKAFDFIHLLYPNDESLYFATRGTVLLTLEDYGGARQDLEKTLQIAPSFPGVREQLKVADGVLKAYEELKTSRSDYVDYLQEGRKKYLQGAYAQAIEDYARHTARIWQHTRQEDDIWNPKLFAWRGDAKRQTGDFKGAIADYSRWMELEPDSLEATVRRGLSYLLLGDKASAEKDFEQFLKTLPDAKPLLDLRIREAETLTLR